MPSRIIVVPEELLRRFDTVYAKINDLENEDREMVVDDLITAAENRVKVLQK